MLIQPGEAPSSVMESTTLVRTNSEKYIFIKFMDEDGNLIDIDESVDASGTASGTVDLQLTDIDGSVLYEETYWPNSLPSTRRITNPSTGKYQIQLTTDDTSNTGIILANWHIRRNSATDDYYKTQVIDIVSPKVLSILPRFRLILDKSLKLVNLQSYCNLGYTDAQLVIYLQAGLAMLSSTAYGGVAWANLESFPVDTYWQILGKAALVTALTSQTLFAIDTDVPQFSSQGESFMVNHAAPLKALRDSLVAELKQEIGQFVLRFVSTGSVGVQFQIGLSHYALLSSSPNGALFRNSFVGGN